MLHDGRRLYNELGVDIEPNWLVIFELLKRKGAMTLTEISEGILLSHPSVITITNKMIDAGYLISEKHEVDSRKRVLDLSHKAISMLPKYEKIWSRGEKVIEEAMNGINGLECIANMEDHFFKKGYRSRMIEKLKG